MVDFNSLAGVDDYRAAFPTVFSGMSDSDANLVADAVHSSVLEGWEPSADAVQRVADRVLRDGPSWMTDEEIDALVAQVTDAKSA